MLVGDLAGAPASHVVREYIGRGGSKLTIVRDGPGLSRVTGTSKKPLHVMTKDEFVHQDNPHQRFRLLDDADGYPTYLQCVNDGFTRYRNDPPSLRPPTGPPVEPRWEGDYAVQESGATFTRLQLSTQDGLSYLADDQARLRLDYHQPGIYYRCDGEVLDLTRNPPTCANTQLHRLDTAGRA